LFLGVPAWFVAVSCLGLASAATFVITGMGFAGIGAGDDLSPLVDLIGETCAHPGQEAGELLFFLAVGIRVHSLVDAGWHLRRDARDRPRYCGGVNAKTLISVLSNAAT
jgi:hypothetical protein